ncbi:MAG: pyridoxal phosphate-dependent aminotransferase [Flavobacteriaceae bacterium]
MSGFARYLPHIAGLPATVPFVGPESLERQSGRRFRARLGANESAFGPAPSVIEAIRAEAPHVWKYPDPEAYELRTALSAHLGVPPGQITIGEGIDGLLGLIVRMLVEPGTPVVTSLGAYPTFHYHVAGFGGRLVTVPYREDREDLDGLLKAARREKAPLVYLANPDNPMGTWWPEEDILSFARTLPEETMLVLDEAYGETAPATALPPAGALLDLPNVIRTRTFSKAYGLAGIRIGYAFGTTETIALFDRIRHHFGVGRLPLVAAQAALKDQAWLQWVVERIAAGRERIYATARANNLAALPSVTNFVAVDCGADRTFAAAVVRELGTLGVFVRMPIAPPLDRCIRVSVGLDSDLDAFAEALPKALKAAGR